MVWQLNLKKRIESGHDQPASPFVNSYRISKRELKVKVPGKEGIIQLIESQKEN